MFILIENGKIFDPEPRGTQSLLIANGPIEKLGDVDGSALDRLGVEVERIDASDCVVVPGLVDPHAHLLGEKSKRKVAFVGDEHPSMQ